MVTNKLIAGGLGLWVASALVGSGLGAPTEISAVLAAAAPCEPVLDAPKPPTRLRIISANNEPSYHPSQRRYSGPYAELESGVALAATSAHTYFDLLSSRSDCMIAYHMRSQAQLDSVETGKTGISQRGERRLPITYDSSMDAALVRIDPQTGSTDSETKRFPIAISSGSMFLTWDFRFDGGHRWLREGYLGRHKTFQVGWHGESNGDNRWLVFKTDYQNAAQAGQGVTELFMGMGGTKYYGPGTYTIGQEIVEPRLGRFFIEADTWTRVWIWLQDIDRSVSYLSVWVADETREPQQLYDRIAVIVPPGGLDKFWLEYDTSGEDALNSEMRSWNRNLAVLKNLPVASVGSLLQRPKP